MFLTRQRILDRACDGEQWRYEVEIDGDLLQLWSIWQCVKSRFEHSQSQCVFLRGAMENETFLSLSRLAECRKVTQ